MTSRLLSRSKAARSGIALLALASLTVACGSDEEESDTTEAPAGEEEYEIVSDAAVVDGWTTMIGGMTSLSADPSTADEASLNEIHELWKGFEGTVKQNDPDAYLAAEEALDAFLSAGAEGDAAGMAEATGKMTTTSAAYLAAYPG